MADTLVEGAVGAFNDEPGGIGGQAYKDISTGASFFILSSILKFSRTIDKGVGWTTTDTLENCKHYSCWYDKWTPVDTGELFHVAWVNSTTNDLRYANLNISTGVFSGVQVVVGMGVVSATSSSNRVAITKAVNGDIYVAAVSTNTLAFYKSSDNFSTAGTVLTDIFETVGVYDPLMLFPANTGDTADVTGVYWDQIASELSVKMYDSSLDSITEKSIATGMTSDPIHMNMDGAIRFSDNHLLVGAHSDDDNATDDLRVWDITLDSISAPTITPKTNIFTDQVESAQVALTITQQNDDVYLAYIKGGTWQALTDVVFHKSIDGMATWEIEQAYSELTDDIRMVTGTRSIGSGGGRVQWVFYNDDLTNIYVNEVNDIEIVASAPATVSLPPYRNYMQPFLVR